MSLLSSLPGLGLLRSMFSSDEPLGYSLSPSKLGLPH
jgi:hypothetical protein